MNPEAVTAASASRVPSRRARVFLAAALLVGLALRLGFSFGYWKDKPLTLDEQEYLLLGDSFARGEGLRYPDGSAVRHFERPPGFAAFVGGVLVASGTRLQRAGAAPTSSSDVPAPLRLAQVLVGVLGIAVAAAIAREVAGPAAGAIAALVAAVYPPLVWIGAYVLAEPLYSVLALGAAWLLLRGAKRSNATAWLLAAGLVAGAGVLTKEAIVFFVPLAAAWLLVRGRLLPAIAFAVGVGLVLAPWIAHNYGEYGRFVLTAPHGGVTFWTGNNPLAHGEGDLAANPEMAGARVAFERRHAGESADQLDSAYYREALGFIVAHPARWLAVVARKCFYTFVPVGPSYRLHSDLYFRTTLVSYLLLLPCGVAGLLSLASRHRLERGWALWLLAASTVLMSLVFFPQERFRIPVLDPTLIVAAAAWVSALARLEPSPGQAPSLRGVD